MKWHLLSRADQIRRNKNRRAFGLAPRAINGWTSDATERVLNDLQQIGAA